MTGSESAGSKPRSKASASSGPATETNSTGSSNASKNATSVPLSARERRRRYLASLRETPPQNES